MTNVSESHGDPLAVDGRDVLVNFEKMLKSDILAAKVGLDSAEHEPTFEPMARAGLRADDALRAPLQSHLRVASAGAFFVCRVLAL